MALSPLSAVISYATWSNTSIGALVLLVVLYITSNRKKTVGLPYPPGPPPKMLIGNLNDLPKAQAWLVYQRWSKIYGDIIHLRLFGSHLIILNSIDDVRELLEKRSHIYSSRPQIVMNDLMGWKDGTVALPYGQEYRKHRQFAQQAIVRQDSLEEYLPIITNKVNILLRSLCTSPGSLMDHCKTLSVAIVMAIVYGYDVSGVDDSLVTVADEAMRLLTQAMLPSSALVNILPILRFIPSWFPGASFQRHAAAGKKLAIEMRNVPFSLAQKQTADGTAAPSLVSNFIKNSRSTEDYETLKQACAALYGGGVETTTCALAVFFHAMMAYPDVQKKAQREIVEVVGSDRLPNFSDRPSLPYIDALIRELLRWKPILPICLPHTTTEDDAYRGYYIPKGSIIFANIWAIYHDPQKYKEPHIFNPDRFIDENGTLKKEDDDSYAYGFGRRICPGKNLASHSLWLSVASILSVFDIKTPLNAANERVLPPVEFTDAMIPRPVPFGCSIVPKSTASKLIF